MTLSTEEALTRLMDRCAIAEVCSSEALEKLHSWNITGQPAFNIVQKLIDQRFIDDERFVRAFVRSKFNFAKWGRLKIRAALAQKRLDSALISAALEEEIDQQAYYENLAAALRSKAKSMPPRLSPEHRAKLMRFAASRGYEPALIAEMIPEEDFWRVNP